jgi:putative ABC transport system permease protein
MLKNFLKVALRNLWKHKGYSFLNIFGLALGMTCSLLILLWVQDERSVDNYHANGARLYGIYENQYYDGKITSGFFTPGVLADQMKKDLPEVQLSASFNWTSEKTFQIGDKILKQTGRNAGADFFRMFSYPLLAGTPSTALAAPSSIAISHKMANNFFGSPQAAIGKSILYQNKQQFNITAVFEDLPDNTANKFDYLLSWTFFLEENSWAKQWGNNGPQTYLMLRKDADPIAFEKKIKRYLDAYNKEQSKAFRIELGMQRYGDVYLHSTIRNGRIEGGRIEYVRLFSIVAIFILLIACINFMNLTTARSVGRAKEIGIRKVVGALRPALIRQFIGEAVVLSLFAVILALGMVLLALPAFNHLTEKNIRFPFSVTSFWLSLAALTLVTGIISGSYPALFLSGFQPIRVLKGMLKFSPATAWFRKGLVVFQFVLSIVLIIGTIVISEQVNYIQSMNLGYDRDNLVVIRLEGDLPSKYKAFKEAALRLPAISAVTRSTEDPIDMDNNTGGVQWDNKDPNNTILFTQMAAGYDFVSTLNLKLTQGREFSREFPTDSVGYLVNEEGLRRIGYKDPIGRNLTMWGKKGKIIGIIKNFHFSSLHNPIEPLIVRFGDEGSDINFGRILVRIKTGQTKPALSQLEALCHTLNPKFPFTYKFMDEEYQNLYKSEAVVHSLSNCFAVLAIVICCLGLLGLAMFTAEQRTKEFGIRKVLGAKAGTLFSLLSKEFLLLVLIAFILASPLAWWAMHSWLQNFAFHINVSWWIFALAGVLALLIALLTVSYQAIKVAVANPVKSLRTE